MEPFSLEWAATAMGGKILGDRTGTIRGVCIDSRQATPGMLFFALQGENADGHDYAPQALAAGACVVVERPITALAENTHKDVSKEISKEISKDVNKNVNKNVNKESGIESGIESEIETAGTQIVVPATLRALGDLAKAYRQQFAIPIVGVTGSVGKTSTKEMIAAILRTTYNTLASEKNFNNEIGVPLTLFRLDRTHEVAVIEMGMRGMGQIDYLAQIALPTIALITRIGYAHIELLGSLNNIARAKAEIFNYLPEEGIAIVNNWDMIKVVEEVSDTRREALKIRPNEDSRSYDRRLVQAEFDEFATEGAEGADFENYFERMKGRTRVKDLIPAGRRTLTFSSVSIGKGADVRAKRSSASVDEQGRISFRVRIGPATDQVNATVTLKAVGVHHIDNALAALTVGYALNIPAERSIAALEAWEGAEGRMTVRHSPDGVTILDDCYNASPESMEGALETLAKLSADGIAVLGDMRELGDYAPLAHLHIGKICRTNNFRLIVVGELAQWIADEAERPGKDPNPAKSRIILRFPNARQAAAEIHNFVKPGDTLLVKGSRAMGMEVIVQALMAPSSQNANTAQSREETNA